MFTATLAGFKDTPVTKAWICFLLVAPIVVSLLQVQYIFDLAVSPYLTVWHQWWRVPLNQSIFVNQSEIIIAILLLYNLRVIERLIGSAKFLVSTRFITALPTWELTKCSV